MLDFIAQPENVDTPCQDVVNFNFVKVGPSKSMLVFEDESGDVEISTCSKDISLSAMLFLPIRCTQIHNNCVDSIFLDVSEINFNFSEAVVFQSIQSNVLGCWFVSNVANLDGTKLEKLCFISLSTLDQLWCPVHLGMLQQRTEEVFIKHRVFQDIAHLEEHWLWSQFIAFSQYDISEIIVYPLIAILHQFIDVEFEAADYCQEYKWQQYFFHVGIIIIIV